MTLWILFGTFAIALLLGIPVSISLGFSSLVGFVYCGIPLVTVGQRLFTGMDSFPLMAIPLFILAGNIMTAGGISKKLVEFINALTDRIRGALAYTAVFACALFAALSGSGPATVVAIGSMLYPSMKEMGYPEHTSAGLLAVAGGLGPVIPPSIIMIIYATMTQADIPKMFAGGMFWGIVTVITFCGIIAFMGRRGRFPKAKHVPRSPKELGKLFLQALPALLVPVIVLGGIYSGIFTPTESAGIAVVVAVVIGVFIYREITFRDLPKLLVASAINSAVIMFIISCASAFSYLFSYAGLSEGIRNFVVSSHMSPVVFLLFCFVLLIIFGTFMDGTSIAVLLVPLLLPVVKSLGIDLIHFGMVFCILNSLGCCTPPVAVNVFGMANISKLSVERISKGEMPFFIANLVIVLLIIFFPQVTKMIVG